jgi:hypothetical protein
MVQDLDELKSILSQFAEEESAQAKLFRLQAANVGGEPESTGAFVVIGQTEGRRFTELRGLEGELPANIRIEDDAVLGSSQEDPDDWQSLDGPDGDSLRVFTLLDPRTLADQITSAEFRENAEGQTVVLGLVDLASIPGLPEAFVRWLGDDAMNREIELRFEGDRLVETTQTDLYPRRRDRIVERFEV